ncbi:MAG: hypothetical protein E7082_07425 [Bacteroidales bacterium]|nr:hypothetical protein [Bacteroidales bacterium]
MDSETILGYISIILTVVIAILGWIMQRKIEQIKIMENQLSDKKYNAYADLVGLFFGVLKNVKKEKDTNPKVMLDKMIESKKNIFMYGSDKVIHAFTKWLCSSSIGESNEQQMNNFLELMIEIRKDMCGYTSKITKYDLLLNLMQNPKEAKGFFAQISRLDK